MERLLAEIARSHFPNPPATPEQVASFEARVGWRLDDELRAFYLHCDGSFPVEVRPIAASFHEFLARMLASNNEAYWLTP